MNASREEMDARAHVLKGIESGPIQVIKRLREEFNIGLKDAKQIYDGICTPEEKNTHIHLVGQAMDALKMATFIVSCAGRNDVNYQEEVSAHNFSTTGNGDIIFTDINFRPVAAYASGQWKRITVKD